MLLHNYCIECADRDPNGLASSDNFDKIMEFTKYLMGAKEITSRHLSVLPGRKRATIRSNKRNQLVCTIEELGYSRP